MLGKHSSVVVVDVVLPVVDVVKHFFVAGETLLVAVSPFFDVVVSPDPDI